MPSYQPLKDQDIQEIASKYYAARALKTEARETPVLVFVGGQPGAGKSAASDQVRDELKPEGGFIHVDADRMRQRIPLTGTQPTSQETQLDAGRLAGALRSHSLNGERNIVEEGTFRNAEDMRGVIERNQARGYRVELLAVATPAEESTLGIYYRHERQHATGSLNPRFVEQGYHDEAMKGFENALARNEQLLDRVRVINRDGHVLFDSRTESRGFGAVQALTEGQRPTDERLVAVVDGWKKVKTMAEARGAGVDYMEAIDRNIQGVEALKSTRAHSHGLLHLEANIATLRADRRFDAHNGDELVKVAFYRGASVKSDEFSSITPNLKGFDAAMADRSKVAQLPAIDELDGQAVERGIQKTRQSDNDQSL